MVGAMEDSGRLPGLMKFTSLGGTLKKLVMFGDEKSDIWLLTMMPVCSEAKPAPKLFSNSIF